MKFNPKFLFVAVCAAGALFAQENPQNSQKKGFWIFSFEKKELPPRDEMRERKHSMEKLRIFDYVTVFQLENEMKDYAESAYSLKNSFMEKERLIVRERKILIDELDALLQEHKAGRDRSQQILRHYKHLYSNTKKMHSLGMEHAQELQALSQNIYENYQKKIDARMTDFEKNPQELCTILMGIHDQTGGTR